MRHLDELVLDMRGSLDAVVLGRSRCCPNQHVAQARLADVRRAVIGREALDQTRGIAPLAIHEHVLVGHKHLVEHDQRFLTGVAGVARIQVAAIDRACVVSLPTDHVGEPRRVNANSANDGPIAIGLGHAHSRHEDQPMRIDRAGLVHLGAGNVDAVIVAADDAQE